MRITVALAVVYLAITGLAVASESDAVIKRYALNIPQQALDSALKDLAQQTGMQIARFSDTVDGSAIVGPLSGQLTTQEALKALLGPQGLIYKVVNDRTIAVMNPRDVQLLETPNSRTGHGISATLLNHLRLAQSETPDSRTEHEDSSSDQNQNSSASLNGFAETESSSKRGGQEGGQEEVIITGTHIRGNEQPVGAQLITIDSEEIARSGFSSVQDVLRSLPQNFGGGTSEDTLESNARLSNESQGTAINLRGLGTGATLVLLNGRRLAAGGLEGYFTDVSSIPVTAIDRIEVLTDGASALYGADAIGGVVNIILRKRYDGASTHIRFGSVTNGPLEDTLVGQSAGAQWNTGGALVVLEYRDRNALPASERYEMNSDQRSRGGEDRRTRNCNPGTIVSGGQSYAIPAGQDGSALTPADFTAGTANLCDGNTAANILSAEKRWNFFGTMRQQVTASTEFSVDAGYTERNVRYPRGIGAISLDVPNTNAFYVNPTGGTNPITVQYRLANDWPQETDSKATSLNLALGLTTNLPRGWRLVGHIGQSREEYDSFTIQSVDRTLLQFYLAQPDPSVAFNPFGHGSHTSPATIAALRGSHTVNNIMESQLPSASVIADGPILSLPGGSMRVAFGGDYREQDFETYTVTVDRSNPAPLVTPYTDFRRRIAAAFSEILVPLVGPGNRRAGIEKLELSLAGRYEQYNDFGNAITPRAGLRWSPLPSLVVRSTWSKSFKAPLAFDLSEAANFSFILDVPSPSGTGTSAALVWSGGNADLNEETATNWTIGMDWRPQDSPYLSFSASYYAIDFTDRIARLTTLNLADPTVATALTPNPTADQRAEACTVGNGFLGNLSNVVNGDCLTAPVDYLFDFRMTNQEIVKVSGFDVLTSYILPSAYGEFDFTLNGAYILRHEVAQTETSPVFDVVNTANNPLAFKIRGSLGWSRAGFNTAAVANYAGSYEYSLVDSRKVAPWTTIDLIAGYTFEEGIGFLKNSKVFLNIQNLFDNGPPFYSNPAGTGYDPSNADLLRRFVSLTFRKHWN